MLNRRMVTETLSRIASLENQMASLHEELTWVEQMLDEAREDLEYWENAHD
jgi:phage shock protein A